MFFWTYQTLNENAINIAGIRTKYFCKLWNSFRVLLTSLCDMLLASSAFCKDITQRNSTVKLSDVSGKWADILWEVLWKSFLSFSQMEYFYSLFNFCSLKAFPSAWITLALQPRINQNKYSWTNSLACQSTLCMFCCCHGANSVPIGSQNHIITEASSSSTQCETLFHFSGNKPLAFFYKEYWK